MKEEKRRKEKKRKGDTVIGESYRFEVLRKDSDCSERLNV
jgi:hypothetical protein